MIPLKKRMLLIGLVVLYAAAGIAFVLLAQAGILQRTSSGYIYDTGNDTAAEGALAIDPHITAAREFLEERLIRRNGHVNLYYSPSGTYPGADATNSEAMSYALLWSAMAGDKDRFDTSLDFIEQRMQQPHFRYLMWRVESNGTVVGDGENIASDADLRAIKALLIAERTWGDARYTVAIDELAKGLEDVAITTDGLLAPYAGPSGTTAWRAREVWISYEDFTVFEALAERRGEPWQTMYDRMKERTLRAQIHNGLYNSELTENREYGNGIDAGGYGINSLWIMVRNAESDDPELRASAAKSLAFYKQKYEIDAQLFALYSSNGDALSPSDSPWVYALVGRAAIALGDQEFSDAMVQKLLTFQVLDPSAPLYGGFPEGSARDLRVGQFTMQESLLTLLAYKDFTRQ